MIQPTGTGKSFVALALIEENPHARFLYLAPSNYIFRQLRRHAGNTTILKNTILMTYQRLCFLSSEEKRALAPDYIILTNSTAAERMNGDSCADAGTTV